jgi:hypothetical protein
MADTVIELGYHLTLPTEVRRHVAIGQRYEVTVSGDGDLVLSPIERRPTPAEIDQILARTAGLWVGRDDLPTDGVDYVERYRQGRRLDDITDYQHGH